MQSFIREILSLIKKQIPIYSFDHLCLLVYTGAHTLNAIYAMKEGQRRIESKSKLIVKN